MGRIITQVKIENVFHKENNVEISAMVDTGAAYLTIPSAWKEKFGELEYVEKVEMVTATGAVVEAELRGPVRIRISGFRPIYTEVLFVDMEKDADGGYEPLLGYLPLEQAGVAVDMVGHRLISVKYIDCK